MATICEKDVGEGDGGGFELFLLDVGIYVDGGLEGVVTDDAHANLRGDAGSHTSGDVVMPEPVRCDGCIVIVNDVWLGNCLTLALPALDLFVVSGREYAVAGVDHQPVPAGAKLSRGKRLAAIDGDDVEMGKAAERTKNGGKLIRQGNITISGGRFDARGFLRLVGLFAEKINRTADMNHLAVPVDIFPPKAQHFSAPDSGVVQDVNHEAVRMGGSGAQERLFLFGAESVLLERRLAVGKEKRGGWIDGEDVFGNGVVENVPDNRIDKQANRAGIFRACIQTALEIGAANGLDKLLFGEMGKQMEIDGILVVGQGGW